MTDQANIAEAKARISTLCDERADLVQTYRTACEPMSGTGSYGQVSMRNVADAENAQMILKNWDDENGQELAALVAQFGKYFGAEILEQRI